jgi:hypothetical protein
MGSKLLSEIVNTLGRLVGNDINTKHLESQLISLIFSLNDFKNLRENLIKSQKFSIDAFLEHRPEFIKLGKILITYVLIRYENLDNIYANHDWYQYLWNKMNKKFEDFDENKISFITFNYDRSLETYLLNCLMYSFGKNKFESFEKLKPIPIIHVYGKPGKTEFDDPSNYTEFGENLVDPEKLLKTSENIKIMHEDFSKDQEFTKAYELLKVADQVIIVDLGYDEANLLRLKIDSITTPILGSRCGITEMECNAIKTKFRNIELSKNEIYICLEFLRKEVNLE